MVAFVRQYDGEGNRGFRFVGADGALGDGDTDITAYTYDYHNQLTKAAHYTTYANYQAGATDNTVEYTYDYLGRRIERKVDSDGVGSATPDYCYNVYQGANAALEIHDANGLAAAGSGENSPHVEHRYLYGQAVDAILASDDGANVLWGLGDNEGVLPASVKNVDGAADETGRTERRSRRNGVSFRQA
jgi:hypothetical protein